MSVALRVKSPAFGAKSVFSPSTILFVSLVASYVLTPEAYTVFLGVLFILYAASSPAHFNVAGMRLAAPFIAMGVIALLMSGSNYSYLILKDGWYILKLCLCLGVGFLLGTKEFNEERLYFSLIMFAMFGAIIVILVNPLLFGLQGAGSASGEVANLLPLASLAALPILLDRIRRAGTNFRWRDVLVLATLLVGAVLSNSRMTLVAAILMMLAWVGVFASIKRVVISGVLLTVAGFGLWQMLPEYTGGELNALTKFRRSFEEILLSDGYDSRTMLLNWRSFEAFNAQLMFDEGSIFRKILGFGLGAEVNLGQVIHLSQEMSYQYIPTIHNGFYFVLIKFGVVGIFLYFSSVLSWFKWGRGRYADGALLSDRILRGQIAIVLASTAVITGLFNKSELHGVTVLIAFILGAGYRSAMDYRKSESAENGQHPPALKPLARPST